MGKLFGESCPKFGDLYRYIIEIAAAKRPVAVLLENVDYFFHYSRPWYQNLEDAFSKAGYVCCPRLLSADEVGVAQHRRRGFIVAVRADVPGAPFMFSPVPVVERVTVRQVLLPVDSPDLRTFRKLKNEEIHVQWKKPISPAATCNDIADDVPDAWRTFRSGILHLGPFKDPLAGTGSQLYHDLGHHPCITASPAWSPWFLTLGYEKEGMMARKLHIRELCRLQGFPDSFRFQDISKTGMVRQLGNSVPPPMVQWIGRALLEQFREAFVDDDDNDNEGGDGGKEKQKETKRLKTGKSRRKSGGSSRSKSHKHAKRHSKRRSKRHKDRSKRRSKTSSEEKAKHKSSESNITDSESTNKRKLSSGCDMAPPPKRQHRENDALPDEEAEAPLPVAELDGNVEGYARR